MSSAESANPLQDVNFLSGENAVYIAHLYQSYLLNPENVNEEWQSYFVGLGDNERDVLADFIRPIWPQKQLRQENTVKIRVNTDSSQKALVYRTIEAYRRFGHLSAKLNPLTNEKPPKHPSLLIAQGQDLQQQIDLQGVWHQSNLTLGELIQKLEDLYCGTFSLEAGHIYDINKQDWLQKRFEQGLEAEKLSSSTQKDILKSLIEADSFERFLHLKYPTAKRFGLEGCESLIPGLDQALKRFSQSGIQDVVFGMAHRGRLNVLAHILQKPYEAFFAEFSGQESRQVAHFMGDVKYHLGWDVIRNIHHQEMQLSLAANPSHLEFVNTVVLGKIRAIQDKKYPENRQKAVAILLHGDAAFAGQGIVAETLMLSELKGYKTEGTLHIVINNQIGFTTNPGNSRSSAHCTDIAHMIQAPVLHVNADDVEAVVKAFVLAVDYRQMFQSDVVINLVGYRRNGHNETDEPAFTQPIMYQKIASHPSVRSIYSDQLIKENTLTKEDDQQLQNEIQQKLNQSYAIKDVTKKDTDEIRVQGYQDIKTGTTHTHLEKIGVVLTTIPSDLRVHPKLQKLLETRHKMINTEIPLDWGMAESLAFGSLILEGFNVRLSGQDSGRGTFSHRHAVIIDQETEREWIPLAELSNKNAQFTVIDSPLAEASVLGFDYGYTLADKNSLVLWEAQFGDFVNGAQVIIDQFITSSETKWSLTSGLVMLLPHGFEGAGPEHSSARLERFLELCVHDNIQVVNCTTPANYFHVLRRQMLRPYRKPLIVLTPKSLLRHKSAVSSVEQLMHDSSFLEVISDLPIVLEKVKRVVLCSGKIYYDLAQFQHENNVEDVVLVRLEQLYPFPKKELQNLLKNYPEAQVVWCQEEPHNMGAWAFIDPRMEEVLETAQNKHKRLIYIGRAAASSPATGYYTRHVDEQRRIIQSALTIK